VNAADEALSLRPAKGQQIEVNGRPVRLRLAQMIGWGVFVAVCGAALVAGLYFNVLQVNWHVHVGGLNFRLFYLKNWWDGEGAWARRGGMGFIRSPSWPLYRHGLRDLGEPAVATMAVKTLLAKAKWWGVRVGPARLLLTPFVLVALTVAMALGGIWLTDFALPGAWHTAFGSYLLTPPPGFAWVSHASLETLALGFAIGLVLHRVWAPCGATLQGAYADRAVDRARLHGAAPFWVRLPLAPVQLRERFAWMMEHDTATDERRDIPRWLIVSITVVLAYLVVTGFIAHYWIGAGRSFPYLAP